jgi:hypothetical protein
MADVGSCAPMIETFCTRAQRFFEEKKKMCVFGARRARLVYPRHGSAG